MTTKEPTPTVKHCGYCSEGYGGSCDGVQCDISEGKADSPVRAPKEVDTGEMGNTSATLPSVQSEEMEKLLEAEQFLTFSKKCKLRDYLRSLEADKAKLLADWRAMKDGIGGTMFLLFDCNEPNKAIRQSHANLRTILLLLSYTDSPTA